MTRVFRDREVSLPLGRKTYVMGILNVTPDSFSDGGHFATIAAAVGHARRMEDEGADIIDVGAESTRPGAAPVPADLERRRLLPVLEALAGKVSVPVSVDTMKAQVARESLERGVSIVNDVWGFQKDGEMAALCAEAGAGCVLMHNRLIQDRGDLAEEIPAFLARSAGMARSAGVGEDQILLDPGIGFGKTAEESFAAVRLIPRIREMGYPVLVGPSRKRFLGAATGRPVEERALATAAAAVSCAMLGADVIRVHDVGAVVEALKVADAVLYP